MHDRKCSVRRWNLAPLVMLSLASATWVDAADSLVIDAGPESRFRASLLISGVPIGVEFETSIMGTIVLDIGHPAQLPLASITEFDVISTSIQLLDKNQLLDVLGLGTIDATLTSATAEVMTLGQIQVEPDGSFSTAMIAIRLNGGFLEYITSGTLATVVPSGLLDLNASSFFDFGSDDVRGSIRVLPDGTSNRQIVAFEFPFSTIANIPQLPEPFGLALSGVFSGQTVVVPETGSLVLVSTVLFAFCAMRKRSLK